MYQKKVLRVKGDTNMKNTITGSVCLILAASLWGGSYVISKYVMADIPPITLVWLRYLTAMFVLYVVLKGIERKSIKQYNLTKKDWLLLAWVGFIGYFVSIILQFVGTKLSDAHTGSLITSATPAFIILFAWLLLKEKITIQKVFTLLFASIGMVIVAGGGHYNASYNMGIVILIGAALTWALLSIYVKIATQKFSSLFVTTMAVFFGFLFTTPAMLIELRYSEIELSVSGLALSMGYLGIAATAIAFYLWNHGLQLMDASLGSLFFFFQPLVGTLLGWLILNEPIHLNFFIGGTLIVVAVIISIAPPISMKRKKQIGVLPAKR